MGIEGQVGWRCQGQAEMQGKTAAPTSPLGIREEGNSHKTSKEKTEVLSGTCIRAVGRDLVLGMLVAVGSGVQRD